MKNIYKIRNWLPVAVGCFALACVFGAWAAGQIQVTDVGMTSDGHLQIVREGTDPVTVWVRYPGQAEWVPAGKNITTEAWVAPFPGEVAQFKIKPYTSADDADFPPDQDDSADEPADDPDPQDPPADDPDPQDPDTGGEDPLDPSDGDDPTDGTNPFPSGDDPAWDPLSSPKNNQAKATPMVGTAQLIWRHTSSGIVSRWDLAESTGTNFVIRAYDRFRTLPNQEHVVLDNNWVLGGIAALDADGIFNDMIWQNKNAGRFSLWRVNEDPTIGEFGPIQYEPIPGSGVWTNVALASPWYVAGIAALDSDGLANDIIWHHPVSGAVARWELDDAGKITRYARIQFEEEIGSGDWVNTSMPSPWVLGTIAGLDDDGLLNYLIWHHPVSGRFSKWKVESKIDSDPYAQARVTDWGPIQYFDEGSSEWTNVELRSPWNIVGVCELDGDGKLNDIIWHHPAAGLVSRWDVGTNGRVNAYGRIKYNNNGDWENITLTSPWSMRGVVSLNGDGKLNNLIWHRPDSGRFSCWRLTVSGDETRISDFGPFTLDGEGIALASPWEITKVRGK